MSLSVTILASQVTDEYGRALAVGSTVSLPDDYARSLVSQSRARFASAQAGTQATQPTSNRFMSGVVDLAALGADKNASSLQIRNAFAAGIARGGHLLLSDPGTYVLTDQVDIANNNVTIELGAGVTLDASSMAVPCITASAKSNVRLTGNGKIVCAAAGVPTFTGVVGLEVSVSIQNSAGTGLAPVIQSSQQSGALRINALGRASDIINAGRPIGANLYKDRSSPGLLLLQPPVAGITTAVGASCVINSSGAVVVGNETLWQISATSSAAVNNWFEFTLPVAADAFAAGDLTFEILTADMTKFTQFLAYVGNAGYSVFATSGVVNQITPANNAPWAINGLTAYQLRENTWSKNGFTDAITNNAFVNCKLRVFVADGQTGVISLRSVQVSNGKRKARIAIVADDGYASFQTIGVPILSEFGFVSSSAIIRHEVGNAGYASLAQLQAYVDAGNECVPHGPNHPLTGGAGNLFTAWATNAERIADVVGCRDYLLNNGLTTEYGARSYVWPQGVYAASTSDLSMLSLMQANGFTVARAAITPTVHYTHRSSAISTANLAALTLPIIGHTWVSAGTEQTNIDSIRSRIAVAAITGMDCTLMLHRVVGVDAAAQATEISSNRLRQICEAILAEVDAGMMDVVLYSEFAK
jgi:hypothetical protein